MVKIPTGDPPSRMRAFLEAQNRKGAEAPLTRFTLVSVLLFFLFSLIGVRLFWVMVLHPYTHTSRKLGLPQRTIHRADIVDRNGEILATNLMTYSLFAKPSLISNPKALAEKLSHILHPLSADVLYEKLTSPGRFIWLKRNLTPQQKLKVQYLGETGLDFENEPKRVYPHNTLMAHVVGFTDIDNKGLSGIERSFDGPLSQTDTPLALSLDVRIQHILREALLSGMQEFSAKRASGILMDAQTSEIMGMVSLPDFDPHNPRKSEANFNTNTLGIYEMGSVFKIFTFATAFDCGLIKMDDVFDASKPIKFGRFFIKDFHAKNRWLSVPEIFMYSSNIGTVRIALKFGVERQKAFFEKLGFLSPLLLEVGENGQPQYPSDWREINLATISYGYGMAISPIQLLNGVSAVVNGGFLRTPTLLKRLTPPPGKRVITAATSQKMRHLMHLLVKQGSGYRSDAQGYLVGGKTGSANKRKKGGVGYVTKNKHRSVFVGAFPITSPRYILFIMLDEPQKSKKTGLVTTGGVASAPIAREVIEKAAPLLSVIPVDESDLKLQSALNMPTRQGRS